MHIPGPQFGGHAISAKASSEKRFNQPTEPLHFQAADAVTFGQKQGMKPAEAPGHTGGSGTPECL